MNQLFLPVPNNNLNVNCRYKGIAYKGLSNVFECDETLYEIFDRDEMAIFVCESHLVDILARNAVIPAAAAQSASEDITKLFEMGENGSEG